ncbi:hypothetical protein BCR32DRAFT_267329 [Anaeromyces robustus]|uniref:Uncharacterized protein n=1 Tax=Anaeromyces robustus TaxID=1754192 RepID=A0A1Y1XB18_9FUNG|nr:hypothetical protein BCR32DRAFT_267329 [Anaeromyces robustus]|eukprot:ORX82945.1 hypothetical protein BCR32DRAFT_267329 [Anaeromyces robustus]
MTSYEKGYSQSTQNLVKSMMKSSRLTYSQQQILDNLLQEGVAFPPTNYFKQSPQKKQIHPINIYNGRCIYQNSKPKIRTKQMILRRDPTAYQREQFISNMKYNKDTEKEKMKLQAYMASNGLTSNPEEYLKTFPEIGSQRRKIMEKGHDNDFEQYEEIDEVNMLINEIKERQEFLNDMTQLGQGKKYKNKIQFEINERIATLEKLKKESLKKK